MHVQVYSLTTISDAPLCEDDNSPPVAVEDRIETAVKQCIGFLHAVDSDLSPCFPPRTGWNLLDTAFAAVKSRVREIIFWAATDDAKQWTFKGYVNLVELVFELIASACELGVPADTLQDLEADLQV